MRWLGRTVLGCGILLSLLLLSGESRATATPVLIWPEEGFQHRDAAANLTAWFADRLGAPIDPSRPAFWEAANGSFGGADFLTLSETYVLPLTHGSARATYYASGLLAHIGLESSTTYAAASMAPEDLQAVASRIGTDLGLDMSRALGGCCEYIIALNGTTYTITEVSVRYVEPLEFGDPRNVNVLGITFHEPESDLHVDVIGLTPWYRASGLPDVDEGQARAIAVSFAESRDGAENASGKSWSFAVRDGVSFVYIVHVLWPSSSDPYCGWEIEVWIDATSGENLYNTPKAYWCESGDGGGGSTPQWPWFVLPLTALVLAISLFLHLTAERALDQFTRGQIFGFVTANPGVRYAQIRDALRLSNGALGYHLWVLERTGFVRSVREGRVRTVFPRGVPHRHGSLILSRLQYAILDILNSQGPLSPIDLARRLGMSRQRVHYNLKVLRKLALIEGAPKRGWSLSVAGSDAIFGVRNPRPDTNPVSS